MRFPCNCWVLPDYVHVIVLGLLIHQLKNFAHICLHIIKSAARCQSPKLAPTQHPALRPSPAPLPLSLQRLAIFLDPLFHLQQLQIIHTLFSGRPLAHRLHHQRLPALPASRHSAHVKCNHRVIHCIRHLHAWRRAVRKRGSKSDFSSWASWIPTTN
ncbi:hypothetical protein BCR44DRAFT_1277853 [Catenaria anguillulae PL171]|uniref:Uncharacterized protein n=1 Tax=Catenaria anguillulae PL171 TaxID=765915 RepID=A0A1Y2H9G5_9FUNG|nr:hypothetical protein BCR44DRAFT_1277853 [Catenaria anguillulae PL171]